MVERIECITFSNVFLSLYTATKPKIAFLVLSIIPKLVFSTSKIRISKKGFPYISLHMAFFNVIL
jgi:hypothetical protein